MKHVFEISGCGEYFGDRTFGWFDTQEAAEDAVSDYTEKIVEEEHMTILALPEHADAVRRAFKERDAHGYWWYSLPGHGREDDGRYMFLIISTIFISTADDNLDLNHQ